MKYFAQALYAAGLAALLAVPGHAGSLDCITLNTPPTLDGGILDSGALMDAGAGVSLPGGAVHDYNAQTYCPAIGSGNTVTGWTDDGTGADNIGTVVGTPTCQDVGGTWHVDFDRASGEYVEELTWDTMTQPFTACIAFQRDTAASAWVQGDGALAANRVEVYTTSTATLTYAGVAFIDAGASAGGSYDAMCYLVNGASSRFWVRSTDNEVSGNPGTSSLSNITIGARGNGTNTWDGPVYRATYWDGDVFDDAKTCVAADGCFTP